MKYTQLQILETIAFYSQPFLQTARRNVIDIAGQVTIGEGIGALSAKRCDHLVIFIWDGPFRCLIGDRIYLFVDSFLFCLIRFEPSPFEKVRKCIQVWFLHGIVDRTKVRSAFEKHMLQIVCEAGGLRRIELRTGLDSDGGLDARSILID